MNSEYEAKNNKIIDGLFESMLFDKEQALIDACKQFMAEAIMYVLDLHELMELDVHGESKHALGWVLLYNGSVIKAEEYSGGEFHSAYQEGKGTQIIADASTWYDNSIGGYQCILFSDIDLPRINEEHEEEIFDATSEYMDDRADKLIRYFFKEVNPERYKQL